MKHMLRLAAAAALLMVPAGAQRKEKAAPAAPKPAAKPASSPVANTLPAGAEKISEFKWRHKDAAGKTWVYVQTPFGFSRIDEETHRKQEAEKQADAGGGASMVRLVDKTAEQATFEMTTPFGKQRWQKKLSELSDKEKAALAQAAKPQE